MQPGTHNDDRKKPIRKRPPSGLRGWGAAWGVLERVDRDDHREVLSTLVRESGFQGAPALKHMANCLRWEAGLGDHQGAPASLRHVEGELIGERARAMLDPHRELFPKARKPRA